MIPNTTTSSIPIEHLIPHFTLLTIYVWHLVAGKDAFGAYGHSVCGELAAKAGGPAMNAIDRGDTFAMFGHAG